MQAARGEKHSKKTSIVHERNCDRDNNRANFVFETDHDRQTGQFQICGGDVWLDAAQYLKSKI